MENKKIPSQLAVGSILIISLLIGGIFVLLEKREEMVERVIQKVEEKDIQTTTGIEDAKADKNEVVSEACQERFFEGESQIKAWISKSDDNQDGLRVRVRREDLEKLPTNEADLKKDVFVATLIDPTEDVLKDLENSNEENPADITVRGFAYGCNDLRKLSIRQATVAFKKS